MEYYDVTTCEIVYYIHCIVNLIISVNFCASFYSMLALIEAVDLNLAPRQTHEQLILLVNVSVHY